MADVTMAATSISTSPSNAWMHSTAVALAKCMCVYDDGTNLQKCNTDTAAKAACVGLVGNNTVSIGEFPVVWQNGALITGLSGLTRGLAYYVSGTGGTHASSAAGGICVVGSLTANEYVTICGYAESTTTFRVQIVQMGVLI